MVRNNITLVPADVLITTLDRYGNCLSGINRAITNVAGDQFNARAVTALQNDPHAKVIVALKRHEHRGAFRDVVFVVVDATESLTDIVRRGLNTASSIGMSVTIPAIRFDLTEDSEDAHKMIQELVEAVHAYKEEALLPVRSITFVTYGDPVLAQQLQAAFA